MCSFPCQIPPGYELARTRKLARLMELLERSFEDQSEDDGCTEHGDVVFISWLNIPGVMVPRTQ
jgi:hypothetical protein